jgi:hypothetical protein
MSNNIVGIVGTGKKRGRKSKKDIELAEKLISNNNDTLTNQSNTLTELNISSIIENMSHVEENIVINLEEKSLDISANNLIEEIIYSDNENNKQSNLTNDKPICKKRGRKPKGGKIVQQIIPISNSTEPKPNIILHLKCSLKDLHSSSLFTSGVDSFSFSGNNNKLSYDVINAENNNNNNNNNNNIINEIINQPAKLTENDYDLDDEYEDIKKDNNDIRDIWKKLKVLEHYLHVNNICNKKSACFWDTCEFDNPPVYIPKYFMNNSYHVYGCFCSPECAVAHLMNEPIDSSIKFERYYLLNSIYGKIYDYQKNIKPSPNPYYMLEKYYGNLSTQEYRALLRNERLFLVVDKPLTRIMPELHEDNEDFIINNKIIPSNTYQIKKRLQKKQTKTNILSERFGLVH